VRFPILRDTRIFYFEVVVGSRSLQGGLLATRVAMVYKSAKVLGLINLEGHEASSVLERLAGAHSHAPSQFFCRVAN
jgi:hypothetical protein